MAARDPKSIELQRHLVGMNHLPAVEVPSMTRGQSQTIMRSPAEGLGIGSKFSPVQIRDFREAFTLFVKTDEGSLSARDLAIVMRAVGQNPTEAELTSMMREMNLDLETGVIQFDEFLVLMARRGRTTEEEVSDLTEAFRAFDQHHTGLVYVDDLREPLTTTGDRLTDDDFNDLIREAHPDDNGKFSYVDFIAVMMTK